MEEAINILAEYFYIPNPTILYGINMDKILGTTFATLEEEGEVVMCKYNYDTNQLLLNYRTLQQETMLTMVLITMIYTIEESCADMITAMTLLEYLARVGIFNDLDNLTILAHITAFKILEFDLIKGSE